MELKNIKVVLILVLGLFVFSLGNAQNKSAIRLGLEAEMASNRINAERTDIIGTPYITKDFVTASISPLNQIFKVRYNAVSDDMEVMQDEKVLILNKKNKDYIINITSGNKTYKILSYKDDSNKETTGYFVVLSENDKISLYKKEKKKFFKAKSASYAKSSYSSSEGSKPEFKDLKPKYYIFKDGKLEEMLLKKKALLALYPEKASEIKSFMKKNRIKLSEEEDLKKLISFLSTL